MSVKSKRTSKTLVQISRECVKSQIFERMARNGISLYLCVSVAMLLHSLSAIASDMILVPKGTYLPFIKADSTAKVKPKAVNAFFLDKYPVTNSEYMQFVAKNPKWKKGNLTSLYADNGYLALVKFDEVIKKEASPITYVSWFAAKAFCESQKKRLPTTDEWEYAASIPPRNENKGDIQKKIMQWYSEKKPDEIGAIGRYQNRLGVFDMHGLIWEWVYDFNSASVTGDSRADSDIERDLFCGAGAIKANDFADYAAYMRFGYRSSLKGNYTAKYLGFRCARDSFVKRN
jgi:formylglycine-generating enzyme required for sulfatase activity